MRIVGYISGAVACGITLGEEYNAYLSVMKIHTTTFAVHSPYKYKTVKLGIFNLSSNRDNKI